MNASSCLEHEDNNYSTFLAHERVTILYIPLLNLQHTDVSLFSEDWKLCHLAPKSSTL